MFSCCFKPQNGKRESLLPKTEVINLSQQIDAKNAMINKLQDKCVTLNRKLEIAVANDKNSQILVKRLSDDNVAYRRMIDDLPKCIFGVHAHSNDYFKDKLSKKIPMGYDKYVCISVMEIPVLITEGIISREVKIYTTSNIYIHLNKDFIQNLNNACDKLCLTHANDINKFIDSAINGYKFEFKDFFDALREYIIIPEGQEYNVFQYLNKSVDDSEITFIKTCKPMMSW